LARSELVEPVEVSEESTSTNTCTSATVQLDTDALQLQEPENHILTTKDANTQCCLSLTLGRCISTQTFTPTLVDACTQVEPQDMPDNYMSCTLPDIEDTIEDPLHMSCGPDLDDSFEHSSVIDHMQDNDDSSSTGTDIEQDEEIEDEHVERKYVVFKSCLDT